MNREKGFHENYHIQNIKFYESGYSYARDALRPHLAWHGARLSFVVAFFIALLQVKNINATTLLVC